MKPRPQSDMLASGAIGKLLWKLSLPSVAGGLAMSLYSIADIIFIGKAMGPIGIAAVTVVFPLQMFLVAAAQCIGIGGGSRISRSIGAGNREDAGKTFGNMVFMSAILGFSFLTICLLIPNQLLRLFGATQTILPSALDYFHILIISGPIVALTLITLNAIRAEGNAKTAMTALVIGAGMNTLLDPFFIFILDMGIRGAAVATVVSDVISALFLVYYYVNRKNDFPIGWQYLRFVKKIAWDILAVGSASIIGAITMSITTVLMNNVMTKTGGDIALASIGIIWQLFMFLTTPLSAINQGLQPIVGYNFGAEKYTRVVSSIRIACIFSTTLMSIAALLFYRYPEFFIRIFTKDPDLLSAGQSALRIASICLPLVGFLNVGGSIFQTLGQSTSAIIVSLSRQGAIQAPAALILFVLFGLGGIWFSFPVSHAFSFILTFFLLKRNLKQIIPPSTEGTGRTGPALFFKPPHSLARLSMLIVFAKKFLPFV